MRHKKYIILSLMLSLILVLTACGTTNSSNKNNQGNTASSNSTSPSSTATDTASREITHVLGTTIIEGKPQRIVSLYQGATDTLVAFGITPVGAVESWSQQPMYDFLKDNLKDVTYVGLETQPNLEAIAALNPDLILATQVRHEEIYEQLIQIAPTVMNTTMSDIYENLDLLGQSTGEIEKAQELKEAWQNRVKDFQTKAEASLEGWPINATVVNYRDDHARIYYRGFAGAILNELGFVGPKNLPADSDDIVRLMDKESIPNMNADVIFEFYEQTDVIKNTREQWQSHPLYLNLDAVKNNQVFTVDDVIWNFSGGLNAANLLLDNLYAHFGLEK